jgi:hypothetical protein
MPSEQEGENNFIPMNMGSFGFESKAKLYSHTRKNNDATVRTVIIRLRKRISLKDSKEP